MSKRKLLLADDSVTIQKVVNLTFADEGIEVFTVGDGDAAMRKFTEDAPDLVLADVNMPGLDGYRICEKIKQNDATKNIPVILLAGSFEPFDEAEAARVGADDFLIKPFQSIRQLVNKVSDLLDAKTNGRISAVSDEKPPLPDISFDDTLEISAPEKPDVSSVKLGDAGMDDEMIQTAQIGSLPVDEARKFESKPIGESFDRDIDLNALKQPYEANGSAEIEKDSGKIQPLTRADFEEIDFAPENTEATRTENGVYESDDAQPFIESTVITEPAQIYPSGNKITEGFSSPITESEADFDDFDLLDFPLETRESEVFTSADFAEQIDEANAEQNLTAESSAEQSELLEVSTRQRNLSPADVEAIADKVIEKLSDSVIEKIAREVVAQMEKRK